MPSKRKRTPTRADISIPYVEAITQLSALRTDLRNTVNENLRLRLGYEGLKEEVYNLLRGLADNVKGKIDEAVKIKLRAVERKGPEVV